jgi:hypothetical protein
VSLYTGKINRINLASDLKKICTFGQKLGCKEVMKRIWQTVCICSMKYTPQKKVNHKKYKIECNINPPPPSLKQDTRSSKNKSLVRLVYKSTYQAF